MVIDEAIPLASEQRPGNSSLFGEFDLRRGWLGVATDRRGWGLSRSLRRLDGGRVRKTNEVGSFFFNIYCPLSPLISRRCNRWRACFCYRACYIGRDILFCLSRLRFGSARGFRAGLKSEALCPCLDCLFGYDGVIKPPVVALHKPTHGFNLDRKPTVQIARVTRQFRENAIIRGDR